MIPSKTQLDLSRTWIHTSSRQMLWSVLEDSACLNGSDTAVKHAVKIRHLAKRDVFSPCRASRYWCQFDLESETDVLPLHCEEQA